MYKKSLVLLVLLGVTFATGDALANDDRVIVQLRTDATPGVHFDAVRTDLSDGGSWSETAHHAVDPSSDYGRGVRVADFKLDNGTLWEGTIRLLLRGGVVKERPWRVRFSHGHFIFDTWHVAGQGWPELKVVTVLVPFSFVPIDPVTEEISLEEDWDLSGGISPCDVLRYTIRFDATHDLGRGVYSTDPRPGADLIPGSVTTTHGRVVRGNISSSQNVFVRFGFVPTGQKVVVSFLARVPRISNQGSLTFELAGTTATYDKLTDNRGTPEEDDPTVVPLCLQVAPGGIVDELPLPPTPEEIAEAYETVVAEYIGSSLFGARELIDEARAEANEDGDDGQGPGDQDPIDLPKEDDKDGEKSGKPMKEKEADEDGEFLEKALEELLSDGEQQLILRRDAALEAAEAVGANQSQLDRIWKSAKFGLKTVKEIMKRLDHPSSASEKD